MSEPAYRLDVSDVVASLLSRCPSQVQLDFAQQLLELRDSRVEPSAGEWGARNPLPARMLSSGGHQLLVQLNPERKDASIMAMYTPERGWLAISA